MCITNLPKLLKMVEYKYSWLAAENVKVSLNFFQFAFNLIGGKNIEK